ncbi:MAG TPA: hypothetical protein VN695_01855 [Streptosporangiaceae bacterium]|nr:hypothetical protein [Streptosporangiaceae bacterium]
MATEAVGTIPSHDYGQHGIRERRKRRCNDMEIHGIVVLIVTAAAIIARLTQSW